MAATRKILNTGTNKYQNALREMLRSIYSDNIYISLNANTLSSNVNNSLQSLNEFWMTSAFMQRVVRDNYRLCFPRNNWVKSTTFDRYTPHKDSSIQNSVIFDDKIGNGVLFLCVGNNQYNRTDIATASVYRPSEGYASVSDLPSEVITQADGYRWIALAQTDLRFTDSAWVSLEIRDGISFFGSDEGRYVDDGLTLANFKEAVCGGVSFGATGAANFYPVENSYHQTSSAEVSSGSILFNVQNIERFDVFSFQQALKLSGNNTQIRFDAGNSLGALPSTITPITIDEQITNSPFTVSSPLGWYNKKVMEWGLKAGSVEMVYLDPQAGGLSQSDYLFTGTSAPTIVAHGNGESPTVEFITRKINDSTWEIHGVKISTNLSTNQRLVGKNNTVVEYEVTNTDNNGGFQNSIRDLITPYGGLLKEENLYGPIIPVNAFMLSANIENTDITTTLDYTAGNVSSPTAFDSYALVVDAKNSSDNRELGLDLPPNKTEFLDNLITADFTPSSGSLTVGAGDLIYEALPSVAEDAPVGQLIGIVQAGEQPVPLAAPRYLAFTASDPNKFGSGISVYIGSGTNFVLATQSSSSKDPDGRPRTGTIIHMGRANFDISGGAQKRISIKYITRV